MPTLGQYPIDSAYARMQRGMHNEPGASIRERIARLAAKGDTAAAMAYVMHDASLPARLANAFNLAVELVELGQAPAIEDLAAFAAQHAGDPRLLSRHAKRPSSMVHAVDHRDPHLVHNFRLYARGTIFYHLTTYLVPCTPGKPPAGEPSHRTPGEQKPKSDPVCWEYLLPVLDGVTAKDFGAAGLTVYA
jgi:hypothetical protein